MSKTKRKANSNMKRLTLVSRYVMKDIAIVFHRWIVGNVHEY